MLGCHPISFADHSTDTQSIRRSVAHSISENYPSVVRHALYHSHRLYAQPVRAKLVAAALKALFYHYSRARDRCARLLGNCKQSAQSLAAREKIVYYQNAIGGSYVILINNYRILLPCVKETTCAL